MQAFRYMRNRIAAFVALPLKSLDGLSLKAKLREIGRLDGATDAASEQSRDVDRGERRCGRSR